MPNDCAKMLFLLFLNFLNNMTITINSRHTSTIVAKVGLDKFQGIALSNSGHEMPKRNLWADR